MPNEIDSYLDKARRQIAGELSGEATHTAALVELINLVKEQQKRIEQLEARIRQK